MSIPAAISLVTLGVRDVAAATTFYEALGFPLSSASVSGEVSFFRTAGGLLGLYGAEALAADAQVANSPIPGSAASRSRSMSAVATTVDSALESALAAGATVLKPAQETEWGGYHAYFADPDGHAWEVAHNPYWPLDDRGLPQLPK